MGSFAVGRMGLVRVGVRWGASWVHAWKYQREGRSEMGAWTPNCIFGFRTSAHMQPEALNVDDHDGLWQGVFRTDIDGRSTSAARCSDPLLIGCEHADITMDQRG